MKKIFFIFLFVLTIVANSNATNLRGYIQRCNPTLGCYASTFSQIDIYFWNGYQWVFSGVRTYTGADGYYYFYNIAPNSYYIYVNNMYWYQVNVVYMQWQDMPILTYNTY